jgi:hypothetical protein
MASSCPQQVASVPELQDRRSSARVEEGISAFVLDRIGQMLCGISGHEHMLQFEDDRMFLECLTCGHQSPGWQIARRSPVPPVTRVRRTDEPHSTRRVA